jgi:glycosyltransferase involved in cell wall biosynthesis
MTCKRIVIVCNALDDATRVARAITTDSPAASRKVFMMCRATRLAGIRPLVLSLGRGRAGGTGRSFGAAVRRIDGVPVMYAPFTHRRLLSELVSLLAPAWLLWRSRRLAGEKTVLFYNCLPAYIPALVMARLLGMRTVLDLEDGAVAVPTHRWASRAAQWTHRLFDRLCNGGALLACSALAQATTLRPTACYYGTVTPGGSPVRWPARGLRVLIGGTVSADTGADILVGAIRLIRTTPADWAQDMDVLVTGKGDAVEALAALAQQPGWPRVAVHGRLHDAQYRDILAGAQVGLALKPHSGPLSNTTFPSKVVELAGAGLLVLSTDISDVRRIFDGGAIYLEDETPAGLAERLRWIAQNREAARAVAVLGRQRVHAACDPQAAGRSLARFLFRTA